MISQSFGDHLVFLSMKTSSFTFLAFSIIKVSHRFFISVSFFLKQAVISLLFEKEPLNFGRDKSPAAEDMPFPAPMNLPSVLAEL